MSICPPPTPGHWLRLGSPDCGLGSGPLAKVPSSDCLAQALGSRRSVPDPLAQALWPLTIRMDGCWINKHLPFNPAFYRTLPLSDCYPAYNIYHLKSWAGQGYHWVTIYCFDSECRGHIIEVLADAPYGPSHTSMLGRRVYSSSTSCRNTKIKLIVQFVLSITMTM